MKLCTAATPWPEGLQGLLRTRHLILLVLYNKLDSNRCCMLMM
jgi:hypothetical protein